MVSHNRQHLFIGKYSTMYKYGFICGRYKWGEVITINTKQKKRKRKKPKKKSSAIPICPLSTTPSSSGNQIRKQQCCKNYKDKNSNCTAEDRIENIPDTSVYISNSSVYISNSPVDSTQKEDSKSKEKKHINIMSIFSYFTKIIFILLSVEVFVVFSHTYTNDTIINKHDYLEQSFQYILELMEIFSK